MLYLNIMMGRIRLQTEAVRMQNTLSGECGNSPLPSDPGPKATILQKIKGGSNE